MDEVEALDRIAGQFLQIAEGELHSRSPLYEAFAREVAVNRDLQQLVAESPPGRRHPTLLLAAVHELVLGGTDGRLTELFASAPPAGRRAPVGAGDAFSSFCLEHEEALVLLLRERRTQTNEVGRCAALFPAVSIVARRARRPVALVDIGASAGLNLNLDRYRYDYGNGLVAGDPQSPVTIECALRGDARLPLARRLTIAQRIGLDIEPIDPGDPRQARWLRACLWPGEPDRVRRLDSALTVAADHPVTLVGGDAVELVPKVLATIPDEVVPCLLSSWAVAYLSRQSRVGLAQVLESIGSKRDLAWVSLEAEGVVPGLPLAGTDDAQDAPAPPTVLGLTSYDAGAARRELLAVSQPHGRWLRWLGRRGG